MDGIPATPSVFAECPVWLSKPQRLFWIDCAAGSLWSLDWRTRRVETLLSKPGVLFSGLVKYGPLTLLVLTSEGALLVDQKGRAENFDLPVQIDSGLLNDGKCDVAGRPWIGQVRSANGLSDGAIFRLSNAIAEPVVIGLGIPNGPAFDPAGRTVYYSDSLAGTINAFDLDGNGVRGAKRLLHRVAAEAGQPDGMTVDSSGDLFVVLFDGGALLRLDPANSTVERISLPFEQPTSCTFGGPDLKTLFVTAANGAWPADRRNVGVPSPADPELPSLYIISMATPGVAEPNCLGFEARNFSSNETSM